jgi:hypothetical protein
VRRKTYDGQLVVGDALMQITITDSVAVVEATRAMLGVGIGLMLSGRMPAEQRQRVGLALVMIGAAMTIPTAMAVFWGRNEGQQALAA